jgi:hypothetical protein
MAVTIQEMDVEVADRPPPAAAPSSGTEPKKDTKVTQILEILRERTYRLQAD